jgi:hypothetical protein
MAAMRMETIFKIVRGFNEARSPISQLHTSVDGIKSTVQEVASTVNGVKESAREFDKNMGVLKEFNERFKALADQVIGLQEETVSQRTGAAGAAADVDSDEQNWEELRTIWKSNNQRLEAIIKNNLVGAKQRKYDNYPRTDYTVIIDRLFEDGVLTRTARDKSIELHRMFMSYRSRRKPVTDKVVGDARLLGEQLNHLMDTERLVKDDSGPNGPDGLARPSESQQRGDLAGASAGDANDRPDRPTGA